MTRSGRTMPRISPGRVVGHILLVFGMTALPSFWVGFFGGSSAIESLGVGLRIASALAGIVGFAIVGIWVGPATRIQQLILAAGGVWMLSLINVLLFEMTGTQWIIEGIGIAILAAIGGAVAAVIPRKGQVPQAIVDTEEFERAARLPILWQFTARQMIAAANLLAARPGSDATLYTTRTPILLLYGLAAENLVKAVLIMRGTQAVVADRNRGIRLNPELKEHDLVELCRRAQIDVSADDKDALRTLSWIVQSGKYPVGTKPGQHPDEAQPQWFELTDLNRVLALLEVLESHLRTTNHAMVLERTNLGRLGLETA